MDRKKANPDKGPPMREGENKFDKGYQSDDELFDPYSECQERGNEYFKLQNEIVHKDTKKMRRDKFTKIA